MSSEPTYRARRGVAAFLNGEQEIWVVDGMAVLCVEVTDEELRWLLDCGLIENTGAKEQDAPRGRSPRRRPDVRGTLRLM